MLPFEFWGIFFIKLGLFGANSIKIRVLFSKLLGKCRIVQMTLAHAYIATWWNNNRRKSKKKISQKWNYRRWWWRRRRCLLGDVETVCSVLVLFECVCSVTVSVVLSLTFWPIASMALALAFNFGNSITVVSLRFVVFRMMVCVVFACDAIAGIVLFRLSCGIVCKSVCSMSLASDWIFFSSMLPNTLLKFFAGFSLELLSSCGSVRVWFVFSTFDSSTVAVVSFAVPFAFFSVASFLGNVDCENGLGS